MSSVDQQRLINYLDEGGSVYMEGADVAYSHHTQPFFNYFGTGFVNTGANEAITSLTGFDGTLASGLDYYYFGGYDAHYKIDELSITTGTTLLESEDQKVRAVSNLTDTYKTICSSPLLGAFANGAELNLRAFLMGQYIDFLGFDVVLLLPPTNLAVDETTGIFTWNAPILEDLIGYNVYLDDELDGSPTDTQWQFTGLVNGQTYIAGVSAFYDEGESDIEEIFFTYTGTNAGDVIVAATKLNNNYPNPFNPETNIAYSIKETGKITLEVYNIKGQLVKTLVNDIRETGSFTTTWNGTDNTNKTVSSGVYFYKMRSSNYTSTKKMILMK